MHAENKILGEQGAALNDYGVQKAVSITGQRLLSLIRPTCRIGSCLASGNLDLGSVLTIFRTAKSSSLCLNYLCNESPFQLYCSIIDNKNCIYLRWATWYFDIPNNVFYIEHWLSFGNLEFWYVLDNEGLLDWPSIRPVGTESLLSNPGRCFVTAHC